MKRFDSGVRHAALTIPKTEASVVDQDADVIDILIQPRRYQYAADRLSRRLLFGQEKNQVVSLPTD